ncbi:MAG: phosphatase PAP2 family protein [Streptococcaceae bacterium]|nr:phosphatase PAP2 family protein [Streptococcaceae bacterium]
MLFTIENTTLIVALITTIIVYFYRKRQHQDLAHYWRTYLLMPIAACLLIDYGQTLTYDGTRWFTQYIPHLNFATSLDKALPLISWFVIFYLSAYVVIVVMPFVVNWIGGNDLLKKYIFAIMTLFIISTIIYLIFPNDVPHAWNTSQYSAHTGVFDKILQVVYDGDAASNGLPSLHNAHAWLPFFLILFNMKDFKTKKARKSKYISLAIIGTIATLISLSTLFCKEHYIADVVFSIGLVALISWGISRIYQKHQQRIRFETVLIAISCTLILSLGYSAWQFDNTYEHNSNTLKRLFLE